ncbi:unnamed protein product, partial [Chrysoparadoxa australica]
RRRPGSVGWRQGLANVRGLRGALTREERDNVRKARASLNSQFSLATVDEVKGSEDDAAADETFESDATVATDGTLRGDAFNMDAMVHLREHFPADSPIAPHASHGGDSEGTAVSVYDFVSGGGDGLLDESELARHSVIAEGSYGSVEEGMLVKTGEMVAIKVEVVPEDPHMQANLLSELAVLRGLAGKCETIVELKGALFLEENGLAKVAVVMELCTQGALREALKQKLSWSLKVRVALDIAAAVTCLAEHRIVHRDIKTTNVLLSSDWRAKLCDFNLSIDDESPVKMHHAAGTEAFMAPELFLGEDFTFSGDIFSFGVMLWEMIVEREPEDGFLDRKPQASFIINMEALQELRPPDVPEGLWALASDCCDPETDIRPEAEGLQDWLDDMFMADYNSQVVLPSGFSPRSGTLSIRREGQMVKNTPAELREKVTGQLSPEQTNLAFSKWVSSRGVRSTTSRPRRCSVALGQSTFPCRVEPSSEPLDGSGGLAEGKATMSARNEILKGFLAANRLINRHADADSLPSDQSAADTGEIAFQLQVRQLGGVGLIGMKPSLACCVCLFPPSLLTRWNAQHLMCAFLAERLGVCFSVSTLAVCIAYCPSTTALLAH